MVSQATTEDLEGLIRRVVREEFLAMLRAPETILEVWEREERDEERHDAILLREALEVLDA